MIAATGTLRDRVARLVIARAREKGGSEKATFTWVAAPGPVVVREADAAGEATVEFTVPEGCECLDLYLPTGLFRFLAEDQNADGALLVIFPDGTIEAHIVECKRTVGMSTWAKAVTQMYWTLVKLQALAGTLGESLAGAVFYTAFREDRFDRDTSPNPAQAERIVGPPATGAEVRYTWRRRKQLEWIHGRLTFEGFRGDFRHERIALDEQSGQGRAALKSRAL